MHTVVVLALDDVIAFDLSTPCEVFGRVRLPDSTSGYRVGVCGPTRSVRTAGFDLRLRADLEELARADTIVVPGTTEPLRPLPLEVTTRLRKAARAGTRIASICTGAFVLAAAGLLDGLRATTHWMAAELLAQRYPSVTVDPDTLYVDNGQVLTSAGAAAGLDLCLHMVRLDYGSAVAADIARISVMPLERTGGQAQFIKHAAPAPDGSSLEPVLRWLEEHLADALTLQRIARRARLSVRTLNRRFREQVGTTPLQWLLRARVRRAQHLLETTNHSIETIAGRVGFGSGAVLRLHFQRVVATTPQAYRYAFRGVQG
jgi:transcriptional regulator GlxA family with amidase domain